MKNRKKIHGLGLLIGSAFITNKPLKAMIVSDAVKMMSDKTPSLSAQIAYNIANKDADDKYEIHLSLDDSSEELK